MAYRRIHWKDRRVERPRTFAVTQNADGTRTLEDAPGEITQEGTALSAENLNRADEAVQHYSIAFDMLAGWVHGLLMQKRALTDEEIDLAIARADGGTDGTDTAELGKMTLGLAKLG